MKHRLLTICFSFFLLAFQSAHSQTATWPKSFKTSEGTVIKMYEPQPESYSVNLMKIRSAISVLDEGKSDPVFGVIWADISTTTGGDRNLTWENASITNIKLPGAADQSDLEQLGSAIEQAISDWNISTSREALTEKLSENAKEAKLADNLSTTPPKIIYTKKPSMLVVIDGQPDLKMNSSWGVEQVINTPFTLVKSGAKQYFLYGGKKWYSANSISGPWNYVQEVPSSLKKMDADVRANDTSAVNPNDDIVSDIIVSAEPAELIQSNGEANFSPIQGTNLLYMTNTTNDIFMDVDSQKYYVLLSGRWYVAPNLNNSWTYISSENLPADFAKIPEGSSKDLVLSSVAGTEAARESVLEAQVPQTAKVDRKNATATVTYDGEPEFENIQGTDLRYAVNTPGAVLNQGRTYYYVENGVWFESTSANGPWYVATQRPAQVDFIPASYPVYNVKYVYIYDATPDFVYMGYTPGYLGNYIYGPTTVYGTGYYYKPWRGRYYYPRSATWGFNMRYNPWTGWGFGVNLWAGWLSINIGSYHRGPQWGGWWGPPVYRPLYCRPYNNYYGYNSRGYNYNYRISNRSNNVYTYRRDVVTYERSRSYDPRYSGPSRPTRISSGRPGPRYDSRPGNRYSNQRTTPATNNTGSRPVTRNYEPNGQQRSREYNNRNNDNNNNSAPRNDNPARERSDRTVPGQRDVSPRVYTPNNNNRTERNNRVERSMPATQERPANSAGTKNTRYSRSNRSIDQPLPAVPERQTNPARSAPNVDYNTGENNRNRNFERQAQPARQESQPARQERQSNPGVSAPHQRERSVRDQGERPTRSAEGVSRPQRERQ